MNAAARWLRAQQASLASRLVERQFARQPELLARYGELGRQGCLEDANYHLTFLAQAVDAGRNEIFHDYIAWAKVMLARRHVPAEDLARYLTLLRELLMETLPQDLRPQVMPALDMGLLGLPQMSLDVASFLDPAAPLADLAADYLQMLLAGDRREASRRVLAVAEAGTPIRQIYLEVFQRCQRELGRLWQLNQISVGQEHYCTASTQLIMSQLYPYIFAGDRHGGNLVATCVSGDLHEIGVRMVADLFEMDGWNTYYLGANTPAAGVLQMLVDRQAQVLAISATLAIHLAAVQSLIDQVRADPACAQVKVLVGGAPFNQSPDLWMQLGADGYAPDADQAIALASAWAEARP